MKFENCAPLQDAKAALEIQEQILQKSKGDEPWMKEVVTGLAKSAKDFQDSADFFLTYLCGAHIYIYI